MIDSHCHLDHEPLFNQISEVLARSKNAGIKKTTYYLYNKQWI